MSNWRPSPQPPCPCGNCNQPPPKPATERTCTEEDPCRFCGPVQFWDRDPAPVEEPPELITPGQEAQLARAGLEGAAAGRHISAAFRRIFNATRRNT